MRQAGKYGAYKDIRADASRGEGGGLWGARTRQTGRPHLQEAAAQNGSSYVELDQSAHALLT